MAYIVSLKQFDGPLDLLLTLISSAKLDIRDIFVSEITDQYLKSMELVDELDMDTASEFLQMAATLIEIKSRALLPKPPKVEEGEESPEEMLIRQLEEYKAFKEISARMKSLEEQAKSLYTKLPEEFPLPPQQFEWRGLTMDKLSAAFARVLARLEAQNDAEKFARREIRRDTFTVSGCMVRIQRRLRRGSVRFAELFHDAPGRGEMITVFLALLELIKLSRAIAVQEDTYGEIEIRSLESASA
ncbi:MAG: segregation/condensation protein A [Clostridia bacterium]|nr:segregation/condensation protein A [Clostridia bacterium]